MRLDAWLVQHGHFSSRERAQMAIKAGQVKCNGSPAGKPSMEVQPGACIEITGELLRYVSRGGLKLEKAIHAFHLDFQGKRVLDAGASTGGFTDCALQHGAAKVYAVDVGFGQLSSALRSHPQVVFYEHQDVRLISLANLDGKPVDAIVADLSFVSLTHILPSFPPLLAPDGFLVLLIKPQFEMESRLALKGGILKDRQLQEEAIRRVVAFAKGLNFELKGLTETEVEDEKRKNKEFLAWLKKSC